jgi:hypothetical protein
MARSSSNSRKSASTRTRLGQRLNREPEQAQIVRKFALPDGSNAVVACVNGVYLVARFDAHERPLDKRPQVFTGQHGETNAYSAATVIQILARQ